MKKPPRKNESLVDETFWVWETRFGLWSTQTLDSYEFKFGLTGMTRDAVVDMTRWHLKHPQMLYTTIRKQKREVISNSMMM